MHLNDSPSVAINEYGTNLHKFKFESLEVIEAKHARSVRNLYLKR